MEVQCNIFQNHFISLKFILDFATYSRLRINFRDVVSSDTSVLMFTDNSMMLKIEDSYNNDDGALVIPVYPFEDFQIYKILFELLEAHWRVILFYFLNITYL